MIIPGSKVEDRTHLGLGTVKLIVSTQVKLQGCTSCCEQKTGRSTDPKTWELGNQGIVPCVGGVVEFVVMSSRESFNFLERKVRFACGAASVKRFGDPLSRDRITH